MNAGARDDLYMACETMSDQEFAHRLIEEFGLSLERLPYHPGDFGEMRGGGWQVTLPSGGVYRMEGAPLSDAVIAAVASATSAPRGEVPCLRCFRCLDGVKDEDGWPVTASRVVVCPDCGNKRCPKATDCRRRCTGSNELGQ